MNSPIADCLRTLPRPPGDIAIDAKIPLDNYYALRAAKDDAARKLNTIRGVEGRPDARTGRADPGGGRQYG